MHWSKFPVFKRLQVRRSHGCPFSVCCPLTVRCSKTVVARRLGRVASQQETAASPKMPGRMSCSRGTNRVVLLLTLCEASAVMWLLALLEDIGLQNSQLRLQNPEMRWLHLPGFPEGLQNPHLRWLHLPGLVHI